MTLVGLYIVFDLHDLSEITHSDCFPLMVIFKSDTEISSQIWTSLDPNLAQNGDFA